MAEIVLQGPPELRVQVKKSKRSRRLSLRVLRATGEIRLSMPQSAPLSEAQDFVHSKEKWIRKHLANAPQSTQVVIGGTVPVYNRMLPILEGRGRRAILKEDGIYCPPAPAMVGPRVAACLKLAARHALQQATQHYAGLIKRPVHRIALKDTRSRWGSCSSRGNINYSWRLIMCPPEVLEYVAVHEVAHLVEMNHSQKFWNVVEGLMPDYQIHKAWLRRNGESLHQYRFDLGT